MFCTACGAENPPNAQFCRRCGATIYRPSIESRSLTAAGATHAAAVKCPNCGLTNPSGAERCDCGYDFVSGTVKEASLKAQTDLRDVRADLRGVRGWLLLWCILTTIITPALQVFLAFAYSGVTSLVYMVFAGFALFTGVSTWRVRKNALRIVKVYLVALLCFWLVMGFLSFVAGLAQPPSQAGSDAAVTVGLIRALIGFYISWSYFKSSKRVRATFGANL